MHPDDLTQRLTFTQLMDWFWVWQGNAIGGRRDDMRALSSLVLQSGVGSDDWRSDPPYWDPMTPGDWQEIIDQLEPIRQRKLRERDNAGSGEYSDSARGADGEPQEGHGRGPAGD